MEVRKIKIGPEHESRLRELLKAHEADIDRLSDDELDAAEEQMSQRIQHFIENQKTPNLHKSALRFRFLLKTGTMALLAAAAVMLSVQLQFNEEAPHGSQLVSKGTGTSASSLSCETLLVEEDGTTPDNQEGRYQIAADTSIYLKLYCGQPVYVHVGFVQGETLHLEFSNLEISTDEKVVVQGGQWKDFTALAKQKSDLIVLVTEKPLDKLDLSPADRAGLWYEELSLTIKR